MAEVGAGIAGYDVVEARQLEGQQLAVIAEDIGTRRT
jgi:hypothetical protein